MTTHNDLANALRFLSIDAVQKANSGHPGMPMGMADIATVLWQAFLSHNPGNPNWFNRDRFVLSNGHGSMLQYSLLHLTGYDVSIEDLKNFRQLHSKTPGHPECLDTPGVETTTGPLGQGLANAVGMAMAEKMLASEFNRGDFSIVNHRTFAFIGDGCLMEGISHEVCSLAGTLGLGKLIVLYDDNNISIDGEVRGWFADDTPARFKAYGWQVIENIDGHSAKQLQDALVLACENDTQPTLICCKTKIGFGSPSKVGTAGVHGAPLGEEEIKKTREALEWPHAAFDIPDEIYAGWDQKKHGQEREEQWNRLFAQYESAHPELAVQFLRRMNQYLPDDFAQLSNDFVAQVQAQQQPMATRKASLKTIEEFVRLLPEMVGGSADLSGSNCTKWQDAGVLQKKDFSGRYIHYGVREFGMSAIMNGLALHGGFIPFGGTFLVFSDYARNAVRLSALMKQKVVYVYSHDSIGLGEDGPTHQPIEHAAMLRMTPGLQVWRPADSAETAVSWQQALSFQGPSALLLSRQTLPAYQRSSEQLAMISKGGYVLRQAKGECQGIIISTGSEVELAVEAAEKLEEQNIFVRVVSMPCVKQFLLQNESYKSAVLPENMVARVAVEAGVADGWYQFVGTRGKVIGINQYGYSAPYKQVYQACGVTTEAIVAAMQELLLAAVTS